jgi:hypothetical protein
MIDGAPHFRNMCTPYQPSLTSISIPPFSIGCEHITTIQMQPVLPKEQLVYDISEMRKLNSLGICVLYHGTYQDQYVLMMHASPTCLAGNSTKHYSLIVRTGFLRDPDWI